MARSSRSQHSPIPWYLAMLSKKDLQAIRLIIQEELTALVMRDVVMEKAPRKPGDPPKHTEKLTVNVIDEIAKYMPYVEGAVRGMQADVEQNTNSVTKLGNAIELAVECSMESSLPINDNNNNINNNLLSEG